MAAEAAEAAAAQQRFWEMHDRLLDHQDELLPTDLARHANEVGLDMHRFWDDLRRRDYADRIGEDVASADTSGVAGTPTFFINGVRHQGSYDIDTLADAVRRARKLAQQRRAASVAP
jgi:protein-disulfide isomerase